MIKMKVATSLMLLIIIHFAVQAADAWEEFEKVIPLYRFLHLVIHMQNCPEGVWRQYFKFGKYEAAW